MNLILKIIKWKKMKIYKREFNFIHNEDHISKLICMLSSRLCSHLVLHSYPRPPPSSLSPSHPLPRLHPCPYLCPRQLLVNCLARSSLSASQAILFPSLIFSPSSSSSLSCFPTLHSSASPFLPQFLSSWTFASLSCPLPAPLKSLFLAQSLTRLPTHALVFIFVQLSII